MLDPHPPAGAGTPPRPAGQRIGPFEVEKELGRGAMGAVYRVRHTETGQTLALKCLVAGLWTHPGAVARFEREANVLKQLKHPNIVRLLGTGKAHHTPFLVMEYIDGKTLQQMLQERGRFLWDEVVDIGKQICAALAHAHEQGIVHRDLKPSNLMLLADGTLKLTDFGIAKDLDVTQLTADHHTLGTAAYMSPEQCRGEKNLTNKSDLYALGVVLYELLTGRKPFESDNTLALLRLHQEARFERPSKLVLDIPVWLDTLVCHLLEKKPERRPKDAQAVAQALGDVQEKVATLHSAGVDVAGKTARRSRDAREKATARALLAARRGQPGAPRRFNPVWLQAAGLATLLILIVGVIVYALWPAKPEVRYARGLHLVQQGDELLERGDFDGALVKWYDAEHKYLAPLAQDRDQPYADRADEQLAYLKAGTLYVRSASRLAETPGAWKEAKAKGFDELLDKFPAGNKFVEKARAQLQRYEAPDLLREGQKLADPEKRKSWPAARARLDKLLRRYPQSDQADPAQRTLDRLAAHEKALTKLEEARRSRRPAVGATRAEELALRALELEQHDEPDKARALWQELKALGENPNFRNDRSIRPWVLLAEEKLRAKEG
jgi:predicted Ser/Thr protein kinase